MTAATSKSTGLFLAVIGAYLGGVWWTSFLFTPGWFLDESFALAETIFDTEQYGRTCRGPWRAVRLALHLRTALSEFAFGVLAWGGGSDNWQGRDRGSGQKREQYLHRLHPLKRL
jgi:hypothetical protein